MHDCIKRDSRLERKDFVAREIAICIRLLDIIMEKDAVINTWLKESYGRLKYIKVGDTYKLDTSEYRPLADFPVYALHLYHLIREYKLLEWWC